MKKNIMIFLMVLLTIISIPVNAKTDNGFYADENITLEKRINTTTFAAGNNVEVFSEIDGASFIAGNNISVSSLQDYLFAAGNIINIKESTAKDAFIAGNSITIKSSTIRDLYVAADTITIESDITRNVYLSGEKITLNGAIDGNVTLAGENIIIGENTIINGTLKYPEEAKIEIDDNAVIAKQKTYESPNVEINVTIIDKVTSFLYRYISMLIVGLVLLKIYKKLFEKIKENEKDGKTLAKTALAGFITLIIIPIISLILMVTVIGISISIISLVLYGILIYLSIIPTAYYFGNWILREKISNEYLLLAISLFAIYILKAIPYLGGWIGFFSLCFGLGVYINYLKSFLKEK